jgi:hypothetical protein
LPLIDGSFLPSIAGEYMGGFSSSSALNVEVVLIEGKFSFEPLSKNVGLEGDTTLSLCSEPVGLA